MTSTAAIAAPAISARVFFGAVRAGDLETVRMYFAQPHVRRDVDDMNARARTGGAAERDELWLESALHGDFVFGAIARRGHVELLAWLFAEPCFVDTLCVLTPRVVPTVIEEAPKNCAHEMLELVLSSQVFTTRMDDHEREVTLARALSYAAAHGANDWLEPLLAHGADATCAYAFVTPLFAASEGGDACTVACLAHHGALVTQSDLITQAVWEENVEVTRELLRLGADPRSATVDHNAALLLAAELRFSDLVELLVRDGVVDVDARDRQGRTPLLVLAADEHQTTASDAGLAAMTALLGQGADLYATDQDGSTALHWAARSEDVTLLRALIARGSDPNAVNADGCTPLRELGECRLSESVEAMLDVLLQCGADPFLPCHAGQTAVDVLERRRHGRAYVRRRRQFFRR